MYDSRVFPINDHQRIFKERPGGKERGADAVFGGTGLSDDEDDGSEGDGVITVKGPLEFLRHPEVKKTQMEDSTCACSMPAFPPLLGHHTTPHQTPHHTTPRHPATAAGPPRPRLV